jgi:hypothetical protein
MIDPDSHDRVPGMGCHERLCTETSYRGLAPYWYFSKYFLNTQFLRSRFKKPSHDHSAAVNIWKKVFLRYMRCGSMPVVEKRLISKILLAPTSWSISLLTEFQVRRAVFRRVWAGH